MKKFINPSVCFTAILIITSTSCQENLRPDPSSPSQETLPAVLTSLTARIADHPDSRTTLQEEDGKILWDRYDVISVYAGTAERAVFHATPNTDATTAVFTGEADLSNMGEDDWLYAISPASYEDACTGEVLTVPLGGWIYSGEETGYHPIAVRSVFPHNISEFPMVARSKSRNLSFFNVCGGIRFTVSNSKINFIIFKNLDGKPISGNAKVSFNAEGLPVIDGMEDGVDEIWASPLYEDSNYPFYKPGEPFYVTLPPGTYSEGMTVTYRTPSTEATYTISGSFDITRSVFSQLKNRDEGLEFKPVDGNIPFRHQAFKNYCVAHFDTDNDGEISYAEALAVTSIIFKETDHLEFDFGDLDELQFFENVTRLTLVPSEDSVNQGGLGYLHLEYFPKLQTLQCYSNKIEELDFSHTPDLQYLDCGGNRLSRLDLSGLTKFRILYCRNCGLQELLLPKEPTLEDIWVDRNNLTVLDLSKQKNLTRLLCYGNRDLYALDLHGLDKLTEVRCFDCKLNYLDVKGCSALEMLLAHNNQLRIIDFDPSDHSSLKYLYCWNNYLTGLDVSIFPNLLELYCADNPISELDLSHNPLLIELECYSNQLLSLDLSANPSLTLLNCGYNQFTTLYVNHNLALETLDCVSSSIPYPDDYVFSLQVVYMAEGQVIQNLLLPRSTEIRTVGASYAPPATPRLERSKILEPSKLLPE